MGSSDSQASDRAHSVAATRIEQLPVGETREWLLGHAGEFGGQLLNPQGQAIGAAAPAGTLGAYMEFLYSDNSGGTEAHAYTFVDAQTQGRPAGNAAIKALAFQSPATSAETIAWGTGWFSGDLEVGMSDPYADWDMDGSVTTSDLEYFHEEWQIWRHRCPCH